MLASRLLFALLAAATASGSRVASAAPLSFTDATAASGIVVSPDQPALRTGVGLAIYDHDGDGLPDVLAGGGVGKPLTLWRNLGGGAFELVPPATSGLGILPGDMRGFAAADYDNDGDVDVFVCNWQEGGQSVLLRNDGGTFADVTVTAGALVGGIANSGAFGDYDGDGLLDLYVVRYYNKQNLLFRNLGDGTFEDVTAAAGLVGPGTGTANSLGALWFDVDRDGDLDLYELNDRCYGGFTRNLLFLNQGDGTFLEGGEAHGLDLCLDAMGAALGDYDLDGWPDVYMTNVAYGHQLSKGGCGGYTDASLESGTLAMQWGWGVAFQDFDNDGLPDLYVAHDRTMTGNPTNRIYQNAGDGTFKDASWPAYAGATLDSYTVVTGDMDLDGDLDLFVADLGQGGKGVVRYLRNDTVGGHSLRVALVGTTSNREGVGAWVELLAGGQWRRTLRYESSAYMGRSEGILHFGLGEVAQVDQVVVRWPSGAVQTLADLGADQVLVVVERDEGGPPAWPDYCGDGLDNDCDGVIDGGDVLGSSCWVGQGACRAEGVLHCSVDLLSAVCAPPPDVPGPVAETCDGLDDDCDGATDEDFPGLGAICVTGLGECRQGGAVVCTLDGVGTRCSAEPLPGAPELCDGLDNDCDGDTDEGFQLGVPCVSGIGQCAASGLTLCEVAGLGVVCGAASPEPQPERCDGLDNDCDGETDEAFADLGGPCSVGLGPCVVAGILVCSPDGGGTVCDAVPLPGEAELCDGVDNDCDGLTDEDFPGLGAGCVAGVGSCAIGGLRVCGADGLSVDCAPLILPPDTELCNGIDDDCDGEADEGFELGAPCSVGVGACVSTGETACTPSGVTVYCAGPTVAPGQELCGNGIDDDCDGQTDEGFAVGAVCVVGAGACATSGWVVCAPGGTSVVCSATPKAPTAELCGNGVDDDCDGETDEGYAVGQPCSLGVGACAAAGVTACAPGGLSVLCEGVPGAPGPELCGNGVDDDCDGLADEGFGIGGACTTGVGACMTVGTTLCGPGGTSTVCWAPAVVGGHELCGNGIDDDCDGETDEGFGVGETCSTGVGACMTVGTTLCGPGGTGTVCWAPAVVGGPELCGNGIDDDCDGETDEGFGVGEPCTLGVGACQAGGLTACAPGGAGTVCLAPVKGAGDELCGNGIDDDCDGETDEGFGVGEPCLAGEGDCATPGVTACASAGDGVVCEALPGPARRELCGNGIDDDCDGETDEAFGVGEPCTVGLGACAVVGMVACAADRLGTRCDGQAGQPGVELCGNGIDDDCDGGTDEGFGLGVLCYVGAGECQVPGKVVCGDDGLSVDCLPDDVVRPAETCGDGVDDDCDGAVDEGFGLGQPCWVGVGACLRQGVVVCNATGDGGRCSASAAAPGVELPGDAVDNDCDGEIDEAPGGDVQGDAGAPEGASEGDGESRATGDPGGCSAQRGSDVALPGWSLLLLLALAVRLARRRAWRRRLSERLPGAGAVAAMCLAACTEAAEPRHADAAADAVVDTQDDDAAAAPATWRVLLQGLPQATLSVWSGGPGDLWVTGADKGAGPLLMHRTADGWTSLDPGVKGHLWWAFGPGQNTVWMSGEHGQILRYDRTAGTFERLTIDLDVPLYGIWGASDGDLWAVGGETWPTNGRGVVVRIVGGVPSIVYDVPPVSPTAAFFKVWGSSAADVWVVGEEGVILHYDGVAWSQVVLPGAPRLVTIHGYGSDDVVVVGGLSQGLIYERRGPGGWEDRSPDLYPMLQGVSVGPEGRAVAAGLYGWVLERRDAVWAELPQAPVGKDWHAVHVDARGDVYVVGGNLMSAGQFDDGAVLCYGGPGCLVGAEPREVEDAGVSPGPDAEAPDAAGALDGGGAASEDGAGAADAASPPDVPPVDAQVPDVQEPADVPLTAADAAAPDAEVPDSIAAPDAGPPEPDEPTWSGDFPLLLCTRLGDGTLAPLKKGQPVEIVSGPQGGIHVEVSLALEVSGFPSTMFVAVVGTTTIGGVGVGLGNFPKLLVEGKGASYETLPNWPLLVYFKENQSTAYLGAPPKEIPAQVCVEVTVAETLHATSCQPVTLVDLNDEQGSGKAP